MKKIAMIAPCRLPVPATKGGAVEELITRIIKDNEEQKELNIDLFTIADPQKLSCSYKLTNIIEVREDGIKKFFDKALDKYYRTASGRDAKRLLDESILAAFKKRLAEGAEYEAVVVENHMSTCMLIAQYCRDKYEVPVYFHMHNDVDTYRSPGYINKLTACGVQFIAVSEYIKGRILRYEPKAVVHVLYNGTDTGRFKRHEKTPGDTFRFLYAGRIIKGKGVKELTEAFYKLTDKNDTLGSRSYALDIAGFSDREYSYEAEIKKLAAGMKDSIRCIEKIPHEEMQKLYDTADVVVMPSMVEESFGLVALEAMAMGMPLIVSDSGALPEVVGDSALIVKREGDYISNLAKAMENLAGSADLTKNLGKRAFERARSNTSFDINYYYKGFLDIISVNVDPKEKISVVIPVYNVEKYLERCIDSVTGQSYKNLEIIVVDDGSTDGSGELCDRLAVDDDRIKVIHQRNMGLSRARNTGLDVMSGDYVFFCDSDDVIAPDTLEKLIFMIKRDRADVAACGFSHVYDEYFETGQGEKPFTSDKPGRWNGHDSVSEMMRNNSICTVACNKLFKRELFDDIRFPLGVLNEDEATIYKVLYKASIVSYTPKLFYKYYQRNTGIMHGGVEGRYKDLLKAFSDRYEFFKEKNEPVLMQHSLISLLDGMKYVYRTVEDKNIKDEVVRKYKETVNIGNAPSLMGGKKKVALLLWKYIRY